MEALDTGRGQREMTPRTWRLLRDGALGGAENMARDVAILEAVAAGGSPPTLRLYGWSPPCLTLGRHEEAAGRALEFCRGAGIHVTRRPTGGRALLHHRELTYSVVAPLGRPPLPVPLQEAYRTICAALVEACRVLGVAAELTPGEVNLSLPGPRSGIPCFQAPAGGEVVVAGRKLAGSAMRVLHGTVLQHGSLLTGWDDGLQAGALGLDDTGPLRARVTTLSWELGRDLSREEVESALVEAFQSALGLGLKPGEPTPAELARARELRDTFAIVD